MEFRALVVRKNDPLDVMPRTVAIGEAEVLTAADSTLDILPGVCVRYSDGRTTVSGTTDADLHKTAFHEL